MIVLMKVPDVLFRFLAWVTSCARGCSCSWRKSLVKRRCALLSAWVVDSDFVERFGETTVQPRFQHLLPLMRLISFRTSRFPLEQTIPRSLDFLRVNPNTRIVMSTRHGRRSSSRLAIGHKPSLPS